MDELSIIYIISALAIGFFIGMVLEAFIDAGQIRTMSNKINELESENEQLKQNNPEVIEIIDKRENPNNTDYFKPF